MRAGSIAAVGAARSWQGSPRADRRARGPHRPPGLPGRASSSLRRRDARDRLYLHETASAADCLVEIKRYAAENPKREWISGDGWSMDFFASGNPKEGGSLDAVVPDRPVYFDNRDGHTSWVNCRALELAGITAPPPTPRTAASSATPPATRGALHEGAAGLVSALVPEPTRPSTSRRSSARRPTSIRSASPPGRTPVTEPDSRRLPRLAERGLLTARAEGLCGSASTARSRSTSSSSRARRDRSAASGSTA